MNSIKGVRLLDTTTPDSIRRLTNLLDIAYKNRAEKDADFLPAGQNEKTTRIRIEGKEVWGAELDGRLIGTFTLAPPGVCSYSRWLRQNGVAEVSQLAVHPDFRMLGIFSLLMDVAEQRATELGAVELAACAAARQKKLIDTYLHRGYRIVDFKWQKNTPYGLAVFSKTLRPPGLKSLRLRLYLRKLKYFRRFIRYRLLK